MEQKCGGKKIVWNRKERTAGKELEVQEKDGLYTLTFPALSACKGVSHLFTTRMGGVSRGEFESMNLSFTRGDEREAVEENYRRIAESLGCQLSDIVCSDQTHTANIRSVTDADKGKGVVRPRDYTDVDGLVTNVPGIALATFYADCVPVYLVDPVKRVIGLAHSGWRGTVLRISACMVERMMREYGCQPENIIAAIGPSICQDCYEVSNDVAEEFRGVFPGKVLSGILESGKEEGKFQLNLWEAVSHTLREAGVKPDNITVTDLCTCCNKDTLFSHRASGGRRGNLGAFLMLRRDYEI